MSVSSDPHAWLRPIYKTLQDHPAFRQFAPAHQFEQLVQAVEAEHPTKAAQMREWSVAAQHALLNHLASCAEQSADAQPVELDIVTDTVPLNDELSWTAKKSWGSLRQKVLDDHGWLFFSLFSIIRMIRWLPSGFGSLIVFIPECWWERRLLPWRTQWPSKKDLVAFKQRAEAAHKFASLRGDIARILEFLVVGLCNFWVFWWFSEFDAPALIAVLLSWRLLAMVRDNMLLLWFDDLLDLHYRKDPRVHSFRRLSVHVLIQIPEVILIFVFLYRFGAENPWMSPSRIAVTPAHFRPLLLASFQSTMTLNYPENVTTLTDWLWMLQIVASVLMVVLVLAVVAGERHSRDEIAMNPGAGWKKHRRHGFPFHEPQAECQFANSQNDLAAEPLLKAPMRGSVSSKCALLLGIVAVASIFALVRNVHSSGEKTQ